MTNSTSKTPGPRTARRLADTRKGAVSLIFAIMIVPLLLIVGIAVDFSFYIQAVAELNLAADAAAMHAVRAMSVSTANGTTYQNAGTLAGQQWFAAQAEEVPGVTLTGTGTPLPVTVTVSYTAPTYTATVTYTGTLKTIFGRLVGVNTWPLAGTASAAISDSFVDIGLMIDNSQSMLIGATSADIYTMNQNTPCAVVTTVNGVTPGQSMVNYSYYLNASTYAPYQGPAYGKGTNYGYGFYSPSTGAYAGQTNASGGWAQTLPPLSGPVAGQMQCDPNLIGGCVIGDPNVDSGYPPVNIYGSGNSLYLSKAKGANSVGACNNGGGAPGAAGPNTPQAPCAFACHQNANGGDWYALSRSLGVNLRLDVVQNAAQSVISSMEQYSPPPQTLLGVGIFTFNTTLQPVYPCTSLTGCASPFGTNLATAQSDLQVCSGTQTTGCLLPPVTTDQPNTDFYNVFSQAATFLTGTAGNGATPATALKNLFIITDGINDWGVDGNNNPVSVAAAAAGNNGQQVVGPIDQMLANPCQPLKNAGYTVYVLYTPYEPLPTWTYTYWGQPAMPASSPIYPSGVTLQNYVTETDPTTFPNYNANYPSDTPVQAALRACASSPSYFYTATNQADITTALNSMLASALNAAARVIN